MDHYGEAVGVMDAPYGKDNTMCLATVNGRQANVRTLNVYY